MTTTAKINEATRVKSYTTAPENEPAKRELSSKLAPNKHLSNLRCKPSTQPNSLLTLSNSIITSKSNVKKFEPLSEEEAIEEELEKSYRSKNYLLKRKFKPALWQDSEEGAKQKSFLAIGKLGNFKLGKELKVQDQDISTSRIEKLSKIGAYASIAALAAIYTTDAFAVEIEAATKAGVAPLRNAVVWLQPYLLGFAGLAGAYFTEGDLKTRAVKTGIGVGALWGVSSALLSWMPVIA